LEGGIRLIASDFNKKHRLMPVPVLE
jgi:hypothetical protein